jgi:hypothetical protein
MDDIATLTPAEATARLAEMGTASNPPIVPQDAQDARAQLNLLSADPGWASALFSGDVAVRAQFDKLNKMVADADTIGDAISGIDEPQPIIETLTSGQIPARNVKQVIDDMRLAGISDGSIEEALRGTPVTAREYAAVTALQAAKHVPKSVKPH